MLPVWKLSHNNTIDAHICLAIFRSIKVASSNQLHIAGSTETETVSD